MYDLYLCMICLYVCMYVCVCVCAYDLYVCMPYGMCVCKYDLYVSMICMYVCMYDLHVLKYTDSTQTQTQIWLFQNSDADSFQIEVCKKQVVKCFLSSAASRY
jgi:hypothetical protein